MNLLQAIADPKLFGPWFRDQQTWAPWLAFLTALFGHTMTAEQLALYQQCTGRTRPPASPASEVWLAIGRRGGKSFMMALLAVFLACFCEYRIYLAPGERATILIIAADRKQARVILRYIRALLTNVPMLARMIESETKESFELSNSVTIEVGTASFRTTRGYTFAAVLADEIAFWRSEDSANPDVEVLAAIRPGMATIPTSMLICASSPYARRGALYEAFEGHYGKDDDPVLVWRAQTLTMNPTVPKSVVEEAYRKDPAWAAAEYGAEFRTDVEGFVSLEAVRGCIEPGVRERLPLRANRYVAFVDPSGGSSDSMTLAIAFKEGDTAILAALREIRPPFGPEAVVEEFCTLLKSYRLTRVHGDRYGGEWCREPFRRHGINYEIADRSKSDLYRDLLPLINSGGADLLDDDRLVAQLVQLERKVARGGRDSIDHGPGGHDDVANAAAGALVTAAKANTFRVIGRPPVLEGIDHYNPLRHAYSRRRA